MILVQAFIAAAVMASQNGDFLTDFFGFFMFCCLLWTLVVSNCGGQKPRPVELARVDLLLRGFCLSVLVVQPNDSAARASNADLPALPKRHTRYGDGLPLLRSRRSIRRVRPTAWTYAAVSSSPQEITLNEQLKWCTTTAKEHGWTVTRVFKGVGSGKLGTRKLLDELLIALANTPKPERPSRVLMVRIDRLGRGTGLEGIAALAELKRLGVTLFTRESGEVSLERASDSILPAVRSIVAALENETRSDRVRAGHARRRAAGKHLGAVGYGYVLVDGKPVAFEPEAVIVREIFDLLAASWGFARIAGHVRAKAPRKRLGDGSERAMTWGPSTVRSIYKSEVVRAVVVDEKQLAAAEQTRASNYRFRPTGEWEWPLRGAVRCTCGHLLAGHATGQKPWRIRYYRCRSHPVGEPRPGHRADALEASFVDILQRLAADPDRVLSRTRKNPLERLQGQETGLRQQLTRIDRRRRRACELAEDGAYSSADLKERLERIDTERRALSAQLADVVAQARAFTTTEDADRKLSERLAKLAAHWVELPITERQAIAKAVSAYTGGLYADPKRPGKLLVPNVRKVRIRTLASAIGGVRSNDG